MVDAEPVCLRHAALSPHLDARGRRSWAAAAQAAGHGGIAAVSRVTGLAASAIRRGGKELAAAEVLEAGWVRRPGGGRKSLAEQDTTPQRGLLNVVSPGERGDPMPPLRWTCQSTRQLADELARRGHVASHTAVGTLPKQEGFSLQASRKTREGSGHPDRGAHFAHINQSASAALAAGQPVIPVDTKKKEPAGDFRDGGRAWRPQGAPEEVQAYDFLAHARGRAIPYGVYDLACNAGWAGAGLDHGTAAFAVRTIRRWWQEMGHERYPEARRLVITADGGGSNGTRVRLWKHELQGLANGTGLGITVHHLPPGTGKWNRTGHRLFSFISQNWRARPLVSYRVIAGLIGPPPPGPGWPSGAGWTRVPIPGGSASPTRTWPPSTSSGPSSTANGITQSSQVAR